MAEARDGQIVTFYSFKGGTGRTMALANVAWILAASGKRVLVVDWDLESPGLSRYFSPFLPPEAVRDTPGVIDLIREFDTEAMRRQKRGETFQDVSRYAQVSPYTVSLEWRFPVGGALDFMSCGRQNMDYATTIGSLGWDNFYDKLNGGRLFDALRADMKLNYDYTFIDSRTGFSDIADICTVHLPDTLVNCFTLNTQGIEGAVQAAAGVAKYRVRGAGKRIRVLPVPMRVENAEKAKADAGRNLARRRFDGLPAGLTEPQREKYWADVAIPYQSFYAYEETLATFGDDSSGPMTLLGAYERLAGYITDGEVTSMPRMESGVREHWLKRFARIASSEVTQVLLDYEPEDEAWAEWVERVLGEVKIQVKDRDGAQPAPGNGPAPLILTIVSKSPRQAKTDHTHSRYADEPHAAAGHGNHRAIYVADMRPLDGFPVGISEQLAGKTATEATLRLTQLVGCDPVPDDAVRRLAEHYPGNEPTINNAPTRNPQFTGRAEVLRQLREQLREQRTAAVIPVTLRGGVGKTQLAIEYVHRYKSEYDVIWWVQSGQPQFIDTALVDLGTELAERFGVQVRAATGATAEEDAFAVVKALGQGRPVGRWLLVFDNADDPAAVHEFIPAGSGHVLVTSRNRGWDQYATTLDIDVFDRAESITHLRQRAPQISLEDADKLADALGDLPFAVSLTGAWLSMTGRSVAAHLRRLEQHGPLALPDESPLSDYPETLVTVLDSSLDEVRAQSNAAHRLLQLCSFLSGESIALGLIYSPAMVSLLKPFDPTLTEPDDIARHVQQLNRLALIKLDNHAQQFQIHRLLQVRAGQRLAADEVEPARHGVHTLLAANKPRRDVDDPETWPRYRMLWPHLDPSGAAACHNENVRTLMVDRVRYMWTRGPMPAAAETGRAIEKLWQARLDELPDGDDATALRKQLLHLRFNLANILRQQAQYDAAWQLDTQVLEEQRELLGRDHRHTLMTSTGLAADLRALGRYREALDRAEETYKAWSQAYGEDFERTLDAANNLGICYRLAGRYTQAHSLDEATYERRRRVQGDQHPRTLVSASAIGRDLREAGRYATSVLWLQDLLATTRRQIEPDPRNVAEIQVNLAGSLRAAGRFAEATPHLDAAYAALKSLDEADSADTLACRLCRSANLLAADDYAAADRELHTVLSSYRRLLGPDHPITLVSASNHVAVLRSLKHFDEALATAHDTVDRLRSVLGRDFPYTLAAEMNLATCLADVGQLEKSRALDEETAARLVQLLGAAHPDALRAAANLELTRKAQAQAVGKVDRNASAELDRIIEQLAQLIGREHPSVTALQNGDRNHRVLDPQPF